ncbi:NAD(P)-dependent oxidoreductase [uncultured Pelagimonas sp.]|uniref:NAD-dependent epimerase/dehydratase family protein n=1 Tax=uncultured Pelagimonas sp. TaxID=1618102 RepID=UPI0026360ECB|nr:NAD(P)-dependent oxidoreductase [uncultured Pelagimonas sp.]
MSADGADAMGNLTRILITGANGFVGRAAVAEARHQGLEVVAVYRREPLESWAGDPGVFAQRADLSDRESIGLLKEAMSGVGAVIHAAAHMGGDADKHADDTLRGTEILLEAMQGSEAQLILVSSIAVYDTMQLDPGATLTENSPLESPETARDAYTAAKLQQETQCSDTGRSVWIMRPGAVYGPGRTWHALLGFWASKAHVQINSDGQLPLVHVDHLATSLIAATKTPPNGLQAVNIIDDDLPTRARFLETHRKLAGWPRLVLPVPYSLWLAGVRSLKPLAHKLPGLFQEPILRARMMPLSYPNTALRSFLGGADHAPFEDMLKQSLEGQE